MTVHRQMRSSPRAPKGSGYPSSPTSSSPSSRPTTPTSLSGSYPLPSYLNFTPGGLTHPTGPIPTRHLHHLNQINDPTSLIESALQCDLNLNSQTTSSSPTSSPPIYLPSLAALAAAAFHPLTGVPPPRVRTWADALLLTYSPTTHQTLPSLLSSHLPPKKSSHRPCGYVFRRGDIAWNCRTCQTDSTCVLCDACFHASDHEGHEVFFHRTTPGGCCDCGDAEAWRVEGCCEAHRPLVVECTPCPTEEPEGDDYEAVATSARGRSDGEEAMKSLPPRLAAALGVVVGAAVECCVTAVNGSGRGCDMSQWRMRWAEECCRIWAGAPEDEDYYYSSQKGRTRMHIPSDFASEEEEEPEVPQNYRLHLRLHNDDVHTFEEVIDALHDPIPLSNEDNNMMDTDNNNQDNIRLVPFKDDADNMTHHVDSDGQVTVKSYNSFREASFGYRRLKSKGLHCSVVSTAQVDLELRARMLLAWLRDIAGAHPGVMAIVTHALVDVTGGEDLLGNVAVWREARMMPVWCGGDMEDEGERVKKRMEVFRPYLKSSYLTREEARRLHALGVEDDAFVIKTKCDESFYSHIPYHLPPPTLRKSPHALWGTLSIPSPTSTTPHPLTPQSPPLSQTLYLIDTDLRKQQEAEKLTSTLHPHTLTGLHQISGIGAPTTTLSSLQPLLSASSFRAPCSALLLLLLLDPYPTKQLRSSIHSLFLSLLVDPRFKSRFAAALGGVSYRPLSTLFCAGVGTESDTPLGFTVQIFTAGSLVRALENPTATKSLLECDGPDGPGGNGVITTETLPISRTVIRCIHTNLLGCTKEVKMVVKNTSTSDPSAGGLPSLAYQMGEHPLTTALPAAPDDGFLDSKTTRHKRLPHLLRDLEYIFETPQTALRLLLPSGEVSATESRLPSALAPESPPGIIVNSNGNVVDFAAAWARLLRLAQGIDPQKRRISGGHVEYEQSRWLEAFGLSLNFAGTRDALAESPIMSGDYRRLKVGMGTLLTALLREVKLWLYREGLLETGFPMAVLSQTQWEASQRSTLHWNGGGGSFALSCATGVKMTEAQLSLIEHALAMEEEDFQRTTPEGARRESVMGDWLKVPHSPLAGDCLSFHLPLHRAIARALKSLCAAIVPLEERTDGWWHLPLLDSSVPESTGSPSSPASRIVSLHPLATLLQPTLHSRNCRVVWSSGPTDQSPSESHSRRHRSRSISSAIAAAKVVHSLCDHPLRCLAAAQQIERHLWARNGSAAAGMAFNYGSPPLCKSFRDLDLTLVQWSASGYGCGLGPRRALGLVLSRYSMDGYLCDPVRRQNSNAASAAAAAAAAATGSSSSLATHSIRNHNGWVNPPRMQDPDHATSLSEAFFTTISILVTELPSINPRSPTDVTATTKSMRRELLHALAAEPRSHSEAFNAASLAASSHRMTHAPNNDAATAGRTLFKDILRDIAKETISKAGAGAPRYELRASVSDEYDPTFYHLRRNEHQGAMDCVARLRKTKATANGKIAKGKRCSPLVVELDDCHPRFAPCRLILHLSAMDAAIRRALLFALTGGKWLPPSEPSEDNDGLSLAGLGSSGSGELERNGSFGSGTMAAHQRRAFERSSSFGKEKNAVPFSPTVVAASSVSFLEVLQVVTLQVHTLEKMANLYKVQELDAESLALSRNLTTKSYLERLVYVPSSLVDCWALKCPQPLPSAGSGSNRGSILGLLIALYEHRHVEDDHNKDEESGGKYLASDGLKWLLRVVHVLVSGVNVSVADAARAARDGKTPSSDGESLPSSPHGVIHGMLSHLPDLWPAPPTTITPTPSKSSNDQTLSQKARREAQRRALEAMRKQQASFAASIEGFDDMDTSEHSQRGMLGESSGSFFNDSLMVTDDEERCIICRCDDRDGDNNGPLGFLGHVQRSKASLLRGIMEQRIINETDDETDKKSSPALSKMARVVGDRGCQLRQTSEMDSPPVACLPTGSIVTILRSKVSSPYDLLSRRVYVRHDGTSTEGWASVQSSQGYVILRPLVDLCYDRSRWGSTRPLVRQCGHAAHLGCVDAHCLSLHQRAAGEQPYDGRFAANIEDGEFLCPLCKQLSNVLVPKSGWEMMTGAGHSTICRPCPPPPTEGGSTTDNIANVRHLIEKPARLRSRPNTLISPKLLKERDATRRFGANLLQAMQTTHDKPHRSHHSSSSRHRIYENLDPSLRKWDYEDDVVGNGLRLLRQQNIAWSGVGYASASAEASVRGGDGCGDPWMDYNETNRDSHPSCLELRRTLVATVGLLDVLHSDMGAEGVVGELLGDILEGRVYDGPEWKVAMSFVNAMPSHVARDGTLNPRHEARATAAAMWVVKGSDEMGKPPVPLVVRESDGRMVWDEENKRYRPAVASAFLYVPLLAWDLNTMAGAVYSSLLLNGGDLTAEDLVLSTKVLLLSRVAQILVTPGGGGGGDDTTMVDIVENAALSQLRSHFDGIIGKSTNDNGSNVFQSVSLALLPYMRSLVLLLRAATSVLRRHRSKKRILEVDGDQQQQQRMKLSPSDVLLSQILEKDDDILTTTDGFYLLKKLNGPLPSQLIGGKFGLDGGWFYLMESWVKALINFEKYRPNNKDDDNNNMTTTDAKMEDDTDAKMPAALHQGNSTNNPTSFTFTNNDHYDDDVQMNTGTPPTNIPLHHHHHQDSSSDDDSDEDDAMDDVQTVDVIFDEALGDASVLLGLARRGSTSPSSDMRGGGNTPAGGEASDEESSVGSCAAAAAGDEEFASVDKSAIVPFQSSVLGVGSVGMGPRGAFFERELASRVMADLSHFGMVHRLGATNAGLIRLPHSFVELYGLVNKVKGRDNSNTMDESDDATSSETAICLLTGSIMRSGSSRRTISRSARPPGACTLHARKTGSGIGIFFLVQKCTVLLVHNNKSAYYASLYVDEHGEEDPGLRRGRPLFLKHVRYQALETLWRQHGIPREVAQIRSTSDRVIRDNWY